MAVDTIGLISKVINSPWRKLIFPYVEASDDENCSITPTHWLSRVTSEATGREATRLGSSIDHSRSSTTASDWSAGSRASSTSSHLSSTDLADSFDSPWASAYVHWSQRGSDSDGEEDQGVAVTPKAPTSRRRSSKPRRPSSAVEPTAAAAASPPMEKSIRRHRSHSSEALKRGAPAQSRASRKRAVTQPLEPAGPLSHVNTWLPVELRQPALQAHGQQLSDIRLKGIGPSSASDSSIASSESDGSCHGDAGDDNPEAQLAVGIAKLKAERAVGKQSQEQGHAQSRTPNRTQSRKQSRQTPAAFRHRLDSVTDDEIAQHAGCMLASLADAVLELKVLRQGALRSRAISHPDVTQARQAQQIEVRDASIERTMSSDDLLLDPPWPVVDASALWRPSTTSSLRDEVRTWSQARSQTQASTDYRNGFVDQLMSKTPSWADLNTFQLDDEDQDTVDAEEDSDDVDEESHAYSSLWASPVASRSSSRFNLGRLSDELNAFEQADDVLPKPSVHLGQRLSRSAFSESRQDASAPLNTVVSPLWDQQEDDATPKGFDVRAPNSTFPHTRSWASILGLSLA